jgi:CO/xanthine dehydrogenase Mo-binding subunit
MQETATAAETRIDGFEKATGRAQYTDDLPLPYGTLYCAILPSPLSHARIRSIDASRAERVPGVLAVLTQNHLDGMDPYLHGAGYGGGPQAERPFIATEKVRYDGEPVAAVAAETLAIAEYAVSLIDVQYDELPTVFDPAEALEPQAPLLHEAIGSNAVGEYVWSWGDVEQGLRESDRIFEDTYSFPSVFHHPMENIGGCVAEFRGDEVYLLAPIQHMFGAREEIAGLFNLEPEQVHIRSPYIGGGFGAKELKTSHLIALWLARKTGRPVRALATAEGSMRTDCRHQIIYRVRTGVKNDGTLWAQEIELLCNEGAYSRGLGMCRLAVGGAWGPYRVRHMRITGRSVVTNRVPAGAFRSVAKPQVTWGYENNLENIAREMGIDPMEFRLRNFLRRGDIIVEGATPLDSDYSVLLKTVTDAIGWDGRSQRVGPGHDRPPAGGGPVRARGLAATFRHGYSGADNTFATVTLDRHGRLRIHHSVTEIGGGLYNVMARVASRALGIPVDQIEVAHPDTDSPFSEGIASQRMTVCAGGAVQAACEDLKRELIDTAVKVRGGRPEEWRFYEGQLYHGERSVSFAELVRAVSGNGVLMGKGVHRTKRLENAFSGEVPYWGVSTGAAEVEVDPDTGQVRLLRSATAVDVGKAIDPLACRGQIEGAALFGLGNTFYEELIYQDQQLMNADPFQYRLPLLPDLPEQFEAIMIENADGPGPEGAKGVGNTPVSPIAPAIGAAIYEAIGVRIHDLPITPEKVLRALGKL